VRDRTRSALVACDVGALYRRSDLVAKVGEKAQRVAPIIGEPRDQAGEEDPTR